jgi:hypothetical protein
MGVVGFIVARKQPRNPIGWLLLVVVVGILLSLVAGPYASLVYRLGYRLPFGPLAAFLETAYFPVLVEALPPVFLRFPDGVLPSPRWRWVLRLYLTLAAILMGGLYVSLIIGMAMAGIHIDASGNLSVMDHPPASMAWVNKYVGLILFPMLAFWLVFAGRLALSWRRASGDRRSRAAGVPRGGDPEIPAVRHRPDHLPHPGLRDRHRPARRPYTRGWCC